MRLISTLLLSIVILTSCSKKSTPFSLDNQDASFNTQHLDNYLQAFYDNDKWTGSVAIAQDGKIVYNKTLGKLHPFEVEEANNLTAYKIGSITKMFTSIAILQLIEEGKLDFDTKLATFYPSVVNAKDITIEQLLQHRSGIYNFTDHPEWDPSASVSKKDMVEIIANFESDFTPGSKASYSNSAYVLLGYILEDLDRDKYPSIIVNRITSKLNTPSIAYYDGVELAKNEAISSVYTREGWTMMPEWEESQVGAAGALQANTKDLAVFINALFQGKLINDASFQKMKTLNDGYGLGMISFPFNNKKALGHTGGIEGYSSVLGHFEEDNLTFSMITNGKNSNPNDIAIGILSTVYGEDAAIPTFEEVELATDVMEAFVGNYVTEALPMEINVFLEDGVLFAQATGQSAFPLAAEDNVTLTFDGAGIKMVFALKKDGKFDAFTLNQGGQQFDFTREE